jgi:hypothetical protein
LLVLVIGKNCGPLDVHVGLLLRLSPKGKVRIFGVTVRHTIQVALRSRCVASLMYRISNNSVVTGNFGWSHKHLMPFVCL